MMQFNHEWTRRHTNKDTVFLPPDGGRSGHQTVIRPRRSNSLAPLLIRVHWCSFVVSGCMVPA